jgi:hypothetical protein
VGFILHDLSSASLWLSLDLLGGLASSHRLLLVGSWTELVLCPVSRKVSADAWKRRFGPMTAQRWWTNGP